ncbi:hypothetical protein SeMB42_g02813 [Synchytrium endobioticum]|uniref:NADPH:adrenodoxin oxidoreductase, mitochondrial n=1 Tax=Synchytrium endobioticum TaxID=286115 RepID=A0A507DBE0_9FUNG|nr:hypothetical protein SeMB42_g02813 [Synchytrium endobioticum]TPX50557.1 hypothetical protein SeLEV6574_g00844 [Synchytrium endobioticum]
MMRGWIYARAPCSAAGRLYARRQHDAPRRWTAHASAPFHVCVVGSGPAGFYTTQHLLKTLPNVRINMLEALPVPYGLIRYGVAPDHPEVKNVIHKFETIAQDPRFTFIGNVALDRDVSLAHLISHFHAVVLAYGAAKDRTLAIPHEDAPGVLGARALVGWYNGDPAHRNLPLDLAHTTHVVVVGNGNVALDIARVLLSRPDRLACTDIADHALTQLRASAVQRVTLLGRRGPVQASFTAKELREILALPDFRVHADWDFIHAQIAAHASQLDRPTRRLMDIFTAYTPRDAARVLEFRFAASPICILTAGARVSGVQIEHNQLVNTDQGVRAVGSGSTSTVPCQLLVRSIGYQSMAAKGLPFDDRRSLVPNDRGRVTLPHVREGVYVAGWLKRGPSGVIATTMYDAIETAETVASDAPALVSAQSGLSKRGFDGLNEHLCTKQEIKPVYFDGWKSIDSAEQSAGLTKGKPREKIVDLDKMLKAVVGSSA